MKVNFNIQVALVVVGFGTTFLGIAGNHFDYIGTYMFGISTLALALGLAK